MFLNNLFQIMQRGGNMSKKISWIMCGLLAILVMGCSANVEETNSDQGEDVVTLSFFNRWPVEPENTYFKTLIEEFEKENPNIKIDMESVQEQAYKDKVRVIMGTADTPDIFYSWSGEFAKSFARGNKALDLTSYLEADSEWFERIYAAQFGPFSMDDKIYGIPITMDQKIFYYNKNIFDQLGIDPPQTWKDFVTVTEEIKNAGIVPISFGNKEPWAVAHYLTTLNQKMVPEDVRLGDYEGSSSDSFTHPGYIEALKTLQEVVKYTNEDPNSLSYDFSKQLFINEEAAMIYEQTSQIPQYDTSFEIGIFEFPQLSEQKGDPNYITGAPQGYMISANTEHPAEAVKFLKFMTTKEMGQKLFEETGLISAVTGAVNEENANQAQLDSMKQIDEADNTALWLDTAIDIKIVNAYLSSTQLMLVGEKTPEEVMEDVHNAARSLN